MRHLAWIQDQTPARALNGKTPYEMFTKRNPISLVSKNLELQHMSRTCQPGSLTLELRRADLLDMIPSPKDTGFTGLEKGQ
jgi:hypothetical protein